MAQHHHHHHQQQQQPHYVHYSTKTFSMCRQATRCCACCYQFIPANVSISSPHNLLVFSANLVSHPEFPTVFLCTRYMPAPCQFPIHDFNYDIFNPGLFPDPLCYLLISSSYTYYFLCAACCVLLNLSVTLFVSLQVSAL